MRYCTCFSDMRVCISKYCALAILHAIRPRVSGKTSRRMRSKDESATGTGKDVRSFPRDSSCVITMWCGIDDRPLYKKTWGSTLRICACRRRARTLAPSSSAETAHWLKALPLALGILLSFFYLLLQFRSVHASSFRILRKGSSFLQSWYNFLQY